MKSQSEIGKGDVGADPDLQIAVADLGGDILHYVIVHGDDHLLGCPLT